jgi:hypothetical protein
MLTSAVRQCQSEISLAFRFIALNIKKQKICLFRTGSDRFLHYHIVMLFDNAHS